MDDGRLVSLCLLVFTARLAGAVSVEGVKGQHVHGEVDPDEYLWSKLPGRCCFQLEEECLPGQKKKDCNRRPPDSCRACSVWSSPENYCHSSHENCDSCGMKLYCPSPPPMLDGNKVCTGSSRVGYGCNDEYSTGMCAMHNEIDCEETCRANELCELFVYYPEEKKGTCVLCSDLISFERTIEEESRAYAVGASHVPPAPPGVAKPEHFQVMPEPRPPSPPRPPAPVAPRPAASHLGRHKADKSHAHVDCTFLDSVEFTTQRQMGYTDRVAATKEECCQLCGHLETGCANFVFEPTSGQCVLLPLTPLNELEKDDNSQVISGTASVGLVAAGASTFNSDSCSFIPNSGYSSGSMGVAPRLPGGEMQTREECCQVCGVTQGCARFTFSPGNKACVMYAAYAEMVMMNDLTSGSIPSKLAGATIPGAALATAEGAQAEAHESMGAFEPPAPSLPIFAKLENLSPPPPPDMLTHGDSSALQDVISDISVVVFTIISLGFLMCVYCFFAPQILSSLHSASNGKLGKVHVRAHRHVRVHDDDDDAWLRLRVSENTAIMPIEEPTPRRKKRDPDRRRSKSRRDEKRERRNADGRERNGYDSDGQFSKSMINGGGTGRTARLVVQTPETTQSKDLEVSNCVDADALRALFYDVFPSVLKAVRPLHTQLFCLAPTPAPAPAPGGQAQSEFAWLLITSHSEFARVVECPAFRLQDKRCDEALTAQYVVAFATGGATEKGGKKQKRNRAADNITIAAEPSCGDQNAATRGRSRDRRLGGRGYSSAPPSCVGMPFNKDGGVDGGDGSGSDDSATSSRQSLLRGTGTTRATVAPPPPDLARLAAAHGAPPPLSQGQAQLTAQALSFANGLAQVSCQLPGCNTIPPPAAPSVAGSAWDDDDPDGTGVSRSERVRAMAELE